MPWQLSGNGRSGWSTKLIRGLKAEAAAGFQSRRERCREPTPVTPQYAAFPTYKAARVHYLSAPRGPRMGEDHASRSPAAAVPRAYEEVLVPRLFEPWALLLLYECNLGPNAVILDVSRGPGPVARLAG